MIEQVSCTYQSGANKTLYSSDRTGTAATRHENLLRGILILIQSIERSNVAMWTWHTGTKYEIMIRINIVAKYSPINDTNRMARSGSPTRAACVVGSSLNNSTHALAIFLLSSFPVKVSDLTKRRCWDRLIFDPRHALVFRW